MNKKTKQQEISHFSFVLVLEPLMQRMAVELQCSFQASFTLNLHDRMRAPHYLDESHTVTNRQTTIRQHPER